MVLQIEQRAPSLSGFALQAFFASPAKALKSRSATSNHMTEIPPGASLLLHRRGESKMAPGKIR
jgi:hypothetical protein